MFASFSATLDWFTFVVVCGRGLFFFFFGMILDPLQLVMLLVIFD